MSLQNLQADFIDAMLTGDTLTSLHPAKNMAVYHNNVYSAMAYALADAYPMIKQILGDNFFNLAARNYIERYPSRSSDLHDYGEYFYHFIAEFDQAKEFIYLEEMAKFEWACHEIMLAADSLPFNMATLEKYNPEEYGSLHFILHPASRVMRFQYPILDIVELCNDPENNNVDLDKAGLNLIIFRQDSNIKLLPINDAEYIFLYTLHSNMPLTDALEEATAIDSRFNLQTSLAQWIDKHILVDVCHL